MVDGSEKMLYAKHARVANTYFLSLRSVLIGSQYLALWL